MNGDFQKEDVRDALNAAYPNKAKCTDNEIAVVLYKLIKDEKLRYVRERKGRRPAIYHKS